MALRVIAVIAIAAITACGAERPAGPSPTSTDDRGLTPVALTEDWPASTPAAESVDEARLARLVREIRAGSHGGTNTSLLIARHGRLILEEYFNNWNPQTVHTMQSVSKSVTSLAVGIARDRGQVRLDDRLVAFFRDYEPIASRGSNKDALTVRDALTMRNGFDWNELSYPSPTTELYQLNNCGCDWIRFMLDWPMREPPGSRWEYNTGSTILLGAALGRATAQRIDRFLTEHLFGPMQFQGAVWIRGIPDLLPHAGGGLYLRPRDMTKIGQVVLSGGSWLGRQLVSQGWIAESTAVHLQAAWPLANRPAGYGYLWWNLPGGVVTAAGRRGQWIFVVPSLDLVVSATADNGANEAAEFLYNSILPSVR